MLRKASLPPVLHFVPMHEANWPKWREKIFYKVWFGIQCSQWRSILMLGRPWWVDSSWHEGDANPFRLLDVPSKCSRGDIGSALGTIINRTWCNKALIVLLSEFFFSMWQFCIDGFRLWITATMFPAVATACWPCMTSHSYRGLLPRRQVDMRGVGWNSWSNGSGSLWASFFGVIIYSCIHLYARKSKPRAAGCLHSHSWRWPSTNCGWQPNHPWPFWLSII